MSTAQWFSFANSKFVVAVAHGGHGAISFARVSDRALRSGCNWLDLSVMPPGTSIGLHTHGPSDEEIYVVVSGQGRMTLGTDSFIVGPGDVIANPPGGMHGLENIGKEDLRLVVIDVPYPPNRVQLSASQSCASASERAG